VECKWVAKPERRNKILKSKLHRYTPNQLKTFYKQKLL
jgi:hypothetical protein